MNLLVEENLDKIDLQMLDDLVASLNSQQPWRDPFTRDDVLIDEVCEARYLARVRGLRMSEVWGRDAQVRATPKAAFIALWLRVCSD